MIVLKVHQTVLSSSPGRASQSIIQSPALRLQLDLEHCIWTTHPRVGRCPLPFPQLGSERLKNLEVAGVCCQVCGLCWVRVCVVQLPALTVVILLQRFEPARGLACLGVVQQVLEGGRHIQVLVNGKGHPVVEVVNQVEGPLVHRSHGVVHGDLVQALAEEHGGPCWFPGQGREQRPPC